VYGSPNVSLAPSPASPQPVGAVIQWTATASDSQAGTLLYRWQVGLVGGTSYTIRDYYTSNVFSWDPTQDEGNYQITVTVMNQSTGNSAAVAGDFVVTSNVIGTIPVVRATSHPLVALYSAPACPVGGTMRVLFQTGSEATQATSSKPCAAGLSMNFLVGGMRASTKYYMVYQTSVSGVLTLGPTLSFTTGVLPPLLPFPVGSVLTGPSSSTDTVESVILECNIPFPLAPPTLPVATDLSGRIIWYYSPAGPTTLNGTTIYRPLQGGTMLLAANDPTSTLVEQQLLRHIDLLGNAIQETNVTQVNVQLAVMGQGPITAFNHDAIQLPNGHLIAVASNERLLTNVQGPGTVDVLGNVLLDLDENLQVVWSWNAFDYMDTSRLATLGETCTPNQAGCPPVTLASIANDWLHANSVNYSTTDGNLIVSLRCQDWVIKIDYANGAGLGNVIWRLGLDGDFTLTPLSATDPYPWFSHQHDAEYAIPGKPFISLFDNGNVRLALYPGSDSRGQAYWVNETALTAIQEVNADLGTYSAAFGLAEILSNGDFAFTSGLIRDGSNTNNQSVEILENGTINYVLQSANASYRNFRMYSLYVP
jgi:arylsulfate sulfotransferase